MLDALAESLGGPIQLKISAFVKPTRDAFACVANSAHPNLFEVDAGHPTNNAVDTTAKTIRVVIGPSITLPVVRVIGVTPLRLDAMAR